MKLIYYIREKYGNFKYQIKVFFAIRKSKWRVINLKALQHFFFMEPPLQKEANDIWHLIFLKIYNNTGLTANEIAKQATLEEVDRAEKYINDRLIYMHHLNLALDYYIIARQLKYYDYADSIKRRFDELKITLHHKYDENDKKKLMQVKAQFEHFNFITKDVEDAKYYWVAK